MLLLSTLNICQKINTLVLEKFSLTTSELLGNKLLIIPLDIVKFKTQLSHSVTQTCVMDLQKISVGKSNSSGSTEMSMSMNSNSELISVKEVLSMSMMFMNGLALRIYGGIIIGKILMYSVLPETSLQVYIKLLFMDMKDVVMEP